MQVWKVCIYRDGVLQDKFEIPIDAVSQSDLECMLRILAARELSNGEIADCFWREGGKMEWLDIEKDDEGYAMRCGEGTYHVSVRRWLRL